MPLNIPNIPSKIKNPSKLPLAQDKTRFFLTFMVAVMVFIATFFMSGVLAVNTLLDNWNKELSGSITVKIINDDDIKIESDINKALTFLNNYENIVSATILDNSKMKNLLEPWFGENDPVLNDIELPKLIDVKIKNHKDNLDNLQKELSDIVPSAQIDKHRLIMQKLLNFAFGVKTIAFSILLLVLFATAATVIYASVSSFYVHKTTIEVMHMLGAADVYIAWQFTKRTMWLALFGAILGFSFGLPIVFTAFSFAKEIGSGAISQFNLDYNHIFMLSLIPIVAVIISMAASMITVNKNLKEML